MLHSSHRRRRVGAELSTTFLEEGSVVNIYRLALQVQDASNISGVIHSLYTEVLPGIRQEPGFQEQGNPYMEQHPALLLFLDKIVSLTHKGWIHDMDGAISQAYDQCHNFSTGVVGALMDGQPVVIQPDAELAGLLNPEAEAGS
jgi:hypothetical protein